MQAAAHVVASDLVAESFEATEIPFQRIDFNQSLPFDDGQFDLVYSIEVMEHLHRPYDTLRECFRVLKPGGWLIVSTPNILHLQSRFRFLFTGFWDLYQPPSADPANAGRICGHVMPLHLAYYAYGLRLAGFADVVYDIDRRKRGAKVLRLLFGPLLSLMRMRFNRQVARYDRAVYEENRDILDLVNGPEMMTSRSLMFVARRPSGAHA
jgi:SAM-dependent methyltransferase